MGVYVKGMKMPKNCWDCYLLGYAFGERWCFALNERVDDPSEWLKDCPMVEVPDEHGCTDDYCPIEGVRQDEH